MGQRVELRPDADTRAGLKRAIYETDRPSLELERRRAREHAERLVSEGRVRQLVTDFPDGFGALINDLRSWVRDIGDNPGRRPEE
jgi:hypothetical protein